jgi:hypothetical protein
MLRRRALSACLCTLIAGRRCAMSEPDVHKSAAKGTTLERDRNHVLGAARPLPPDADVLIGDLTEDEDRLFLAAILEA